MCLAPAGWVGKKKPKIRSTTHANVEGGSSPRINSMSELWVEKHRPQSVTQIKGQAAVVQRLGTYAGSKNFPHLLFAGPPGTGKTTAAMALTKDIFGEDYRQNLLEMNASDERKLESILSLIHI